MQALLRSAASRRRVSAKCAFPQSITMSPGSINGDNSSITASVGPPACTMMITHGVAPATRRNPATIHSARSDLHHHVPRPGCGSALMFGCAGDDETVAG
jgi:hypothetical protein